MSLPIPRNSIEIRVGILNDVLARAHELVKLQV